jgi:hypothetical protein
MTVRPLSVGTHGIEPGRIYQFDQGCFPSGAFAQRFSNDLNSAAATIQNDQAPYKSSNRDARRSLLSLPASSHGISCFHSRRRVSTISENHVRLVSP